MLRVVDIDLFYGQLQAVRKVSVHVEAGQTVCVLGPNGAGKSTLMRAIAGLHKPSAGRIELSSARIDGKAPEHITKSGVAYVPEGRHIFSSLTVRENLQLGQAIHKIDDQSRRDLENVLELFPILRERQHSGAGKLSGGEQQMLAIARGMLCRPKLMIIDEPSLGLAPLITEKVYEAVSALRRDFGVTFLIVEQNANLVIEHADFVYLMREGKVIMEGNPKELASQHNMISSYFG